MSSALWYYGWDSVPDVGDALLVISTSALIDGRIAPICESRWFGHALVIPRFVLDELQAIADSAEPSRKEKGRKGLDVLNRLRGIQHLSTCVSTRVSPRP